MKVWLTLALALTLLTGTESAIAKKSEPNPAPIEGGERNLHERLGGEKSIRAIVAEFLERASSDPQVNFFRDGKHGKGAIEKMRKPLIDFLSSATGGSRKYSGKDMSSAHAGMKVSESEFNAMVGNLAAALDKLKVADKEKTELLTIIGSTKSAVIGR